MPKKPHSASFGGRFRPGPGRGAVDGGRGRQHLGRAASPGPRGPQCPPNSAFPGASGVGPAHQSQPRFGLARPRPLPTAQGRPARPPQPELQEPPPRTGAGPLGAAPPRGLHRPPCRTRPDRGSPPAAAAAPRPRALRWLWLCPGAERAGRDAGRTSAQSGNGTPGTREGRWVAGLGRGALGGCHWEDSVRRKVGSPGPHGEATRRVLGAELCLRSWGAGRGASRAKLENRSEARFALVCLSLEGWLWSLLHGQAPVLGLVAPVPPPPSPWGGG